MVYASFRLYQFVLKGGNLFVIWQKRKLFRPTLTRIDLLGDADPEHYEPFSGRCGIDSSQTLGRGTMEIP